MKQWENIIREKLEDYEANLPEGSLADFRRRLEESRRHTIKKTRHIAFYSAITTVVACLTILFIMSWMQWDTDIEKDNMLADYIRKEEKNETGKDSVKNLSKVNIVFKKKCPLVLVHGKKEVSDSEITEKKETDNNEVSEENEDSKLQTMTLEEKKYSDTAKTYTNGIITKKTENTTFVTGGVVGGTLIGGLLSSLNLFDGGKVDLPIDETPSDALDNNNHSGSVYDKNIGSSEHSLPIKVGLGFRYPISEKLSLTSGIEYSLYSSTNKSISDEQKQKAHYIGIPARLDYSVAKSRWLDVYFGVGGIADVCVKANMNGKSIEKDGLTFSLQGASGVQLSFNSHLGVFVEPQILWAIPSRSQVLETYRTVHPVSFNISSGVRINLHNPRK